MKAYKHVRTLTIHLLFHVNEGDAVHLFVLSSSLPAERNLSSQSVKAKVAMCSIIRSVRGCRNNWIKSNYNNNVRTIKWGGRSAVGHFTTCTHLLWLKALNFKYQPERPRVRSHHLGMGSWQMNGFTPEMAQLWCSVKEVMSADEEVVR